MTGTVPYYKVLGGWMAGLERGNLLSNSAEPLLPSSAGLSTSASVITSVSAVVGPVTVGSQAFLLQDASGGSLHSAHEAITLVSSHTYGLSVHGKQWGDVASDLALRYWQDGDQFIGFNVQSNEVLFNTGTGTPSIWKQEGGGWFRVGVDFYVGSVGASQQLGICTIGSGANINYASAVGSERGVYFAGMKVELGGVSAYRATTGTAESGSLEVVQSMAQVPDEDIYSIRTTHKLADILNRLRVGDASIRMDNTAGQYTASLQVNQGLSISAVTDAGSEYFLFTGRLKSWNLSPRLGDQEVLIRASDPAEDLRQKISLPLIDNTNVSSLLTDVLSAAGFAASEVGVGALSDAISFAYLDDITAGEAAHRTIQSGAHFMWVDGDGKIRAESRNYDIQGNTPVETMQVFDRYSASVSDGKIINDMFVKSAPRRAATNVGTVAWIDQAIEIPASQSVTFTLEHVDPDTLDSKTPVNSFVTLVASQDYYMSTQQSFQGTDLTAQASIIVTHYATTTQVTALNTSSFQGYLNRCQLRGLPLQLLPIIQVRVETSSSQDIYGRKTREIENDLIPDYLRAQSFAEFMALKYPDPPPDISLSRKNQFPEVVQRRILDPVHIVNSATQVASNFNITGVQHVINFRRGIEHTNVLNVELSFEKDWLVLDSDVLGRLNQRRLGF